MIAESLAQYRIIKKLGKGGMGEVYLAQDTKLDPGRDQGAFSRVACSREREERS